MPFQDFTRRLQGPPQPLTLPEYDLPTQIEPMVDAHQAAVEKIFGKSQPNFAVDVPDNWTVEEQKPQAQPGKPQKYQTLRDLMPKQQRKAKTISARKPGAKTGTMPGTVTARNPLTGSAFDPRPRANNEFDLSLGGPSEAEQMAERALVASGQNVGRDTSRKRSFLQKVQDQQAQDIRSQRLRLEGVDTGETKFDPASLERAGELLRMRKQVESENPLTRFGRRFLTTAAGGLKPDEEFINAPVNRAEDAVNSLMDAATRGIASMPEGFARIADNFLNQGDIAAASAMQKILANHPDMTPAEKTEAQAKINKLHSGLSKMGDYIEPISKMGDEAAKGLYPRDPNAEETINPLKADFWSHTMPQAAGSMLPFMAASGVGGALKIAPELVAGGAGMAMEVPDQYHEARAAGATPEQLARSVDTGMFAGGLEAAGAESLMGKVGLTGKSIPGHLAKEALQEFGQEGAQSLVEDLGAKYYSGHKPELTAGQITMNALQNAVPALFLGAGGGAMGIPAHLAERNHQKIAQQIEQVATTQPDHPVAQTIAAVGIDPTMVSKADDKAIEQLSIRLEAMAKMDSQIQQLQGQQTQVQQQVLNAQQAQQMGRVPSTVEAQAAQQAPVVEQQLAEAEAQQAAIVQDLQQNVSPLFKNLAKAIGKSEAQPISDVADDPKANLLTEVRKAGGISAGEGTVEKGELDRLGIKEAGTTGIISRTGGESADRMRERMASEGLTEAETPQQFIGELEAATKKGKTEAESYADYQRSQMTEQEIADSDKLDEVLADKTHPFTQIYRTLDNPKTIFTKDLAKKFDAAAQQAGFSDDFIERSLVEFQNQRATNPNAKVVEKNLPDSEPGRSMKPAQPGTSVSMSPYKVLEANNKELLQKLHKTNLNSKEGVAGVNQLRDWARANGIEQRHVGAWISDIQNWQKKYGVPENPDAQSSATRAPLGTEVKTPQPARKEAAPASLSDFSLEERQLLGRDHTNLLDSEFDEYLGQLQKLQSDVIRDAKARGIDTDSPRYKGLRSKIMEVKAEREVRRKAGRLPSLSSLENRPTKKKTPSMKEIGKQMVEQDRARKAAEAAAAERETTEVPRETANVPQRAEIDQAAHEAATSPRNELPEPTEAQIEAGNYKKGHISIHGLDVTIENPKGSTRSGVGEGGKKWSVTMSAHYGYVKRTEGADGEQIDVYIGDKPESSKAFVVDQIDPKTGKFDEHKVILGAESQTEAEKLYDAHFDDKSGPSRRQSVTEMSVDGFKEWLKTEDNTKPVSEKSPTQTSETANNRVLGVGDRVKTIESGKEGIISHVGHQPNGDRLVNLVDDNGRSILRGVNMDRLIPVGASTSDTRADIQPGDRVRLANGKEGEVSEKGVRIDGGHWITVLNASGRIVARQTNILNATKIESPVKASKPTEPEGKRYTAFKITHNLRGDVQYTNGRVLTEDEIAEREKERGVTIEMRGSFIDRNDADRTADEWEAENKKPKPRGDGPTRVTLGPEVLAPVVRPLPAKNSTRRIDGVIHVLDSVERVGDFDFELWESGVDGDLTMVTRDAETGDVVDGSVVIESNPKTAKKRFKDKVENARQALGEQSDGQVATAKSVVSGETAGSAAVAESGEAEGKRGASTAFPDTRSGRIAQQLADGKSLTNIQAVRKQFDTKIGTEEAKKLEEDIEFAGVLAARQIVGKGLSTKETYAALLDLHNRMPNLNTRTSESVRDQAYSTPLPIAYAASRLAGITKKTTVYEPTGGNGALVIEANPDNTTINDLNPQRVENLRAQGFEANKADATKVSLGAKVDVVIANPPFGVVKENGQSKQFETPFGKTTEIDHAIMFKALEAMADDGKAVLIVGGVNRMATTRQARSDAYNQSAKRKFYPNLYDNYNVVDHFTIDGVMYAKQGAAWPVDVIVIDGRGKSARQYPAVDVPVIVRSYEELGAKISEGKVLDSTERQQSVGSSEGATARPGRLPGFDDSETSGSTKTGRKSRSSDGGRAKQPATSERPSGERTEPVVRRSAIQESAESATPKRTESQSETAKIGSGVSETTVRENKPAAVGERTDSGIGRTSELDQMFEEEFVDTFGESPKEAQPKREKSPTQTTQTAKVRTETTAKPATKPSLKQSADALMDLFGDKPAKPGPPASRKAPGFDESLYQKAKPQFEAALSTFEGLDDRAAIRELLNYLKSNYGERAETAIYRMKPYIIQFVEDRATPTETKPEAKVEPRQKQVISEQSESSHAAYEPLSTARSLNVAIPKNMSGAVKAALANFEERHGSPDKYVAEKLGYKPEEIEKYFSAEQVDALSLAVDNIEQGKGFVIGDQTGIGKGRINAGIIRYAIKNGKTPVFVTQKPALYADMIRDLKDIGMESIRPLITNSGESIPLNDVATEWMHAAVDAKAKGEKVPKLPSDAKIFRAKPDHVATLEQVGMSGKLKGYDVVFTTYDQMNPMGGLFNKERHAAVSSAVRGGVLIMDESHTAGGVAPAGRGGKPTPSRSKFFRGLVNAAGSVFYSSATYAKRPDVMDLYSKTDLGLLGKNGDALTELFGKGGVALQQVVASKLAEAGQYLRRERTFDGITYSPEVVEVNKQHAENVSTTMRMIVGFDNAKRKAVTDLKENVKASAAIASEDGSIGSAGVDSSNFTSLMHNVIDQMLLGLKADQAAAQAIKAIQNGERPVLTVSNTMESFLKDAGLSPGDAVDLSFKDVLMRYLQRSRDIVIKDRDGNKERRPLTDDELGDKGLAAFEAVQDFINESDFGDIPISPIDRVRELIEKAGYKVDEITGRGTRVDSTTGAVPILRARSAQDTKVAGRRRVIGDFNNGRIDALILNQAGSTGISLHASPAGGKDVKPRHMIIWQAEKNIDTHMQMLGRVNRTGQVTLPRYTQMIADVPAEKRPAAVLLKKMASLSANTTASRKSAVQTEGVTDFINELGDKVVARILTNDTELSNKLGDPLDYDGDELTDTGAARKVSGRIPLLTLAEQHEVYERIESEYADYLAQKEAMGENPLEARTEDFKAETISKEVLTEGVPGSPFSEPAYLEKVKINRTVKPYTSAEVSKIVREGLGLSETANESDVRQSAGAKISRFVEENREPYQNYKKSLTEGIALDDAKGQASALGHVQKAITTANHWDTVARVARPGAMVTVNTDAGSVSGVVLDVLKRGKPKNPVALGSWVVRLAVLDGRELRLSFNEMINKDGVLKVGQSPEVNRLNPETGMFESRPMLPEFDASQGTKKQTRYMVTGNIVSGYAALPKGQILNYTDSEGNVKQGVLLPANFDAAKTMAEMPVELSTASQVIDFFDKVPRGSVSDAKQEITILPEKYGTDLEIRVLSAKSVGGKYYLDKDLTAITGNFVKQGGLMKVNIDRAKLPAVMSWLKEQGIGLNASHKAEAKEMLGQSRTAPPASRRTRESVESSPEFKKLSDFLGSSSVARNVIANLDKSDVDSLEGHAQSIADLLKGSTVASESNSFVNVPLSVMPHVLKVTENPEVLRAIVSFLPVDVVNFFVGKKLAPKHFLRDKAMLEHVLSVYGKSSVSPLVNEAVTTSLIRSVANTAAKVASLARGTLKADVAGLALSDDSVFSTHRYKSITDNPNFSRWFGQSKVVDASGKPMPLYHGTQARNEIEAVDPSRFLTGSHFGPGFYMAESPEIASKGYAEGHLHPRGQESAGTPSVYKLYAKIENPLDVNKPAEPKMIAAAFGSPNVDLEEMGFGSRPTNEVMYKQLAKRLGDDKAAVNQKLQEMGYDGITRLNRASDESPEHREWVVFDPRQVKSATGNRGTFDESANLSTSRREAGGPASKLANPMDVLLYQQSIVKDRGSRGARMYVNDHARAILGASLTEVFGNDYSNVNAINLSREEVKQVADYLATEAKELTGDYKAGADGFVADLRELLSRNKAQRTFNIVDVTAYEARHESGIRSDQERAAENLKGDIREEGFHWSQREVSGQTVALVGSSWAQSSKGFGKYRKALLKLEYPDDPETLAAETAAKIAAGKFDDLGIRTEADHEQAQNWLASYFERVAEKHGIEALEKFDRLLPKAKEAKAKGAQSVKERLRERIEQEQAQSGGTNRPRAPGGESQRVRGTDEGRQENGTAKVRPQSEGTADSGSQTNQTDSGRGGVGKPPIDDNWGTPFDGEPQQPALFDEKGLPRKDWGDMWANLADVLNLPKALRASGDLSAAGRQGWFLSIPPSRWAIAARSFGKGVRSSEAMGLKKGAYKALKRELTQHPAYKDMVAAGWIPMTSDSGELTAQTELFGSRFAGKIPWAKYSEQAYKMNLDFLALSTFELYKKGIDKSSRDLRERHEGYKAAVDWINVSSGRGSYSGRFGKWYKEKPAPFLNVIGWAPGLVYSRMQLLNPVTYAKNLKNPQSRVVFRKQMSELFQSGAVLFLIGAMAKAGGALVSTDPDKADFLKIRFGTTRYDVLAGLQQVARLGIRMGEWARTRATEDGSDEASQKKLKKSANETTSALLRFGRTKLGPVPGFFIDWLNDWKKVTGERHAPGDFIGDFKEGETLRGIAEMTEDPIVSQVIPLFWADMVQAYEQGWRANGREGALTHAAKMLPSGLGIGIQDYDRPEWSERAKLHLDAFDLDPRFPTRKTGEREGDYQKRVRSHMAEQEKAIEQFADDPNLIGQPLERKKALLKQEMSDEGRARLKKIAPEDVADDRMVRAWIQIGVDRLKANPVYQQMSEMEQKHALQSYYGRMNRYKAQPANGQHEYLRPDTVDENVLQEKIKAAISSQQDN